MLLGHPSLDIPVLAGLLLHQQTHIISHQVYTPLQSQLFANKRGLQQGMLAIIFAEQHINGLSDVIYLLATIVLEGVGIKRLARAKL